MIRRPGSLFHQRSGCAELMTSDAWLVPRRPPLRRLWVKRLFDFSVAFVGLLVTCPLIVAGWIIASWDTRSNGLFVQTRIGRFGRPFRLVKLKTMRPSQAGASTVTVQGDPRITPVGRWLRRLKLDELPQLWNVLIGDMSFVGPRPDVPGYADQLQGDDRIILLLRPGITGPATIKYRHEEELLASQDDPIRFNDEVIFPDKVRINVAYARTGSFGVDLVMILSTVLGLGDRFLPSYCRDIRSFRP